MDYNASAVRAEMNRKELRTQWDAGSIGHNIRYNRLLQNYKPTSFPVFLDFLPPTTQRTAANKASEVKANC
jgi:hypothetical protein